jgi:hypothetical protein
MRELSGLKSGMWAATLVWQPVPGGLEGDSRTDAKIS